MKLAIIGSRTITDIEFVEYILLKHFTDEQGFLFNEIVSGKANGVDTIAANLAIKYKIKLKEYPAEWYNLDILPCEIKYDKQGKPYNRLAGFNRNKLIVDYADFILAVTTGSPGTKNSLEYAAKTKKPCMIYYV